MLALDGATAPSDGKCWFFCGAARDAEDLLRGELDKPVALFDSAAAAVARHLELRGEAPTAENPEAPGDASRDAGSLLDDGDESSDDGGGDDARDPASTFDEYAEDEAALLRRDAVVGAMALLVACRATRAFAARMSPPMNRGDAAAATLDHSADGIAAAATLDHSADESRRL